DGARPAAAVAAAVGARLEALRTGGLHYQRLLRQLVPPGFRRERHPEAAQQRARLLVRLGGRGDGDVEPADLGDVVVIDLGKDDLLAQAERVVAAAVERVGVQAAEVADARQRDRDEAVQELPHPGAAQR